MRISDWSSDVCSSDLIVDAEKPASVSIGPELGMGTKADSIDAHVLGAEPSLVRQKSGQDSLFQSFARSTCNEAAPALRKHQGTKLGHGRHVRFVPGRRLGLDRKRVVREKRGSVSVGYGVRRIIKKKTRHDRH